MESSTYEVNLSGVNVCIAIPCYSGYVPLELGLGMVDLVVKATSVGINIEFVSDRENGIITASRNNLLSRFLRTDNEYLFWIDDDILFTPSDFIDVLSWATIKKSVAATYTTRTDDAPKFFIQPIDDDIAFDKDGFIISKGVGLGFACLHRSLIEKMCEDVETYKELNGDITYNVFKTGPVDGIHRGEDVHFFNTLYEKYKQPTYIHPFINLKHVGRKDYFRPLMTRKET